MSVLTRNFTEADRAARDEWLFAAVRNDCDGCTETFHADGYATWTPGEYCPVHGASAAKWWDTINARLDERWPGEWR